MHKNVAVLWDDCTTPMIIRNTSMSPITVYQKGLPAHKQVIGAHMQMHFAWSAILGKSSEAINVEGYNCDFTFSKKDTFGRPINRETHKKLRCLTSLMDGINVMTFLDERNISEKINEQDSMMGRYDAAYLDVSVDVKGGSVQM